MNLTFLFIFYLLFFSLGTLYFPLNNPSLNHLPLTLALFLWNMLSHIFVWQTPLHPLLVYDANINFSDIFAFYR